VAVEVVVEGYLANQVLLVELRLLCLGDGGNTGILQLLSLGLKVPLAVPVLPSWVVSRL
jgi:hypothetical protein